MVHNYSRSTFLVFKTKTSVQLCPWAHQDLRQAARAVSKPAQKTMTTRANSEPEAQKVGNG